MLDIVERSIPHAPSSGVEPVERIGEVVALIGLQSKTPASSGTYFPHISSVISPNFPLLPSTAVLEVALLPHMLVLIAPTPVCRPPECGCEHASAP
jgi:hypothetical protein